MNKAVLPFLFILLIVSLAIYTQKRQAGDTAPDNQNVKDFSPLPTTSTASPENSMVIANNQFSFDLYRHYAPLEEGNMFFSPFSISTALTMTYEGARGKTADEMKSVLHLPSDTPKLRSDFAAVYNSLNRTDKPYQLVAANALWTEQTTPFAPEYIKTIAERYRGKATNVDFINDTEKARLTINAWVEDATNKKIKDLIPPRVLGFSTRLVLTNAIYFKSEWAKQFLLPATQEQPFTLSSGETKNVPMMRQTDQFNYAETDQLQMVELPYQGDDLSMLIVLPKSKTLGVIESELNKNNFDAWRGALQSHRVQVSLPKFKFETKYLMADNLKNMGMKEAFEDTADFSGMTVAESLKISQVIHQTFVSVDENGTEAAAATAVSVVATGAPDLSNLKTFTVDHPFIFIIQDRAAGNILFMGRVNDPSK